MIKVRIHTNNTCLCCNKLEKEMYLIGAFIMCREHWISEFNGVENITEDNIKLKDKYAKWVNVYKELND